MEPPPEVQCLVINEGEVLSVPAAAFSSVAGLQSKIKSLKPAIVTCDVYKLQLILARNDNKWLTLKEAKALKLAPDRKSVV